MAGYKGKDVNIRVFTKIYSAPVITLSKEFIDDLLNYRTTGRDDLIKIIGTEIVENIEKIWKKRGKRK